MINETHVGRLVRAKGSVFVGVPFGCTLTVQSVADGICNLRNAEFDVSGAPAEHLELADECKRCQKRIEPIQAIRTADDPGPFCSSECAAPGFFFVPDGTVLAAGATFVCERGHTWVLRSSGEYHRGRLGRARVARLPNGEDEDCSGMRAFITKLVLPSTDVRQAASGPNWLKPAEPRELPPHTRVRVGLSDRVLLDACQLQPLLGGGWEAAPLNGNPMRYLEEGQEKSGYFGLIVETFALPESERDDVAEERALAEAQGWTFPTHAGCARCGETAMVTHEADLFVMPDDKLVALCGSCWDAVPDDWDGTKAFRPGACQSCGAEGGEMFGVVCAGCFHGTRQRQRDGLLPAEGACFTKQVAEPGEHSEQVIAKVQRAYDQERDRFRQQKRAVLRLDLDRKVGPRYPSEARSDRVLEQPGRPRRP